MRWEKLKAIFLDIDGVLVTGDYLIKSSWYNGYSFNPRCVANLNEITGRTGAFIVVSSNWRKRYSLIALRKIFRVNGVNQRVVGVTPILDTPRGEEIEKYILDQTILPIDRFVIIDDRPNMGDLLPYLVRTSWQVGLDQMSTRTAIEMLG